MSLYFFDSSALIKRYLVEVGSPWIRSLLLPKARNTIVIAEIAPIEVASSLARRVREHHLTQRDALFIQRNFLTHIKRQYQVISLSGNVAKLSRALLFRSSLRTLDAIQLASAIQFSQTIKLPVTFISADQKLLAAAQAEGFAADDPNAHP